MKPFQKETKSQQRRREAAEKHIHPLGMGDRILEQSECATLEDWQESLFRTCTKFTVNIMTGSERHSRAVLELMSFPLALDAVEEVRKNNPRQQVLVYAINPEGRFFCVPQTEWENYRKIWDGMRPKFQDQIFHLIEGPYCIKGGKIYGPFLSHDEALNHLTKK